MLAISITRCYLPARVFVPWHAIILSLKYAHFFVLPMRVCNKSDLRCVGSAIRGAFVFSPVVCSFVSGIKRNMQMAVVCYFLLMKI